MLRILLSQAKGTINLQLLKLQLQNAVKVSFYSDSLYLIANSAVSSIMGFLFWVVIARLYKTEAVGVGSALLSAAALLIFIASLGLGLGLIRHLPSFNCRSALINSCFSLSGFLAVIVASVFLAGIQIFSPGLTFIRENILFTLSFVAFVLTGTYFFLLDNIFIALRGAKYLLIKNSIQSTLKIVLVAVLVSSTDSFSIFISQGIATAIALGFSMFLFLPILNPGYRIKLGVPKSINKEMFRFSFVNYLAEGLLTAPNWLLPVIGANLLGHKSNAYFFISWALANLLFAIPMATSSILFSEGSYNAGFLRSNLIRSLKLTLFLMLPAIVFMMVISENLLFVFGKDYSTEGLKLLWILLVSAIVLSLNFIYIGIARVEKRLKDIILLAGSIAVGTIGLTYLLVPSLGITGFGVSWLVSHTAVAFVTTHKIISLLKSSYVST